MRSSTPTRAVLSGPALLGWAVGLALLTLAVAAACSCFGPAELVKSIWLLRISRLVAAAVVGAGLATSGVAMQALLRNPLAEPYILGVSSGAGVGVIVGMLLSAAAWLPGWAVTPVLSAAGALATMAAVYAIAQRHGRLDPMVLLLSGVIINVFNAALIAAILQFVKQEQAVEYMWWSFGKISEWLWSQPWLPGGAGGVTAIGWLLLLWRGAAYNALGLGDDVAAASGVAVDRLRVETMVIVSIMTAAAVALAGPIGFVGLIVPHICRLAFGPDHRLLLVVSGFVGAIFLMLADTGARVLGDWLQLGVLPVGVITALCGGPFFIVLLRRRGRAVG